MRTSALILIAVAALAACRDGGTEPREQLELEATSTRLTEGQTTELTARLDGRTVRADEVQWISRHPQTVRIENGIARGVAPGVTYAVAQIAGLSDSVRISVSFAGLAMNSVGIRVAGETDTRQVLGGSALLFERSTGTLQSIIHARANRSEIQPGEIFRRDTSLRIHHAGTLALGLRTIPILDVRFQTATGSLEFWGDEGVIFFIDEPTDSTYRFYTPVQPATLEITSITLPSELGNLPGEVTGNIAFEAAGLALHVGKPVPTLTPIGTTTTQIFLEFRSALYRVPISSGVLGIVGSPVADTVGFGSAASMVNDTLVLHGATTVMREQTPKVFYEQTVRIPAPAVGTFDLASPAAATVLAKFADFIEIPPGSGSGNLANEVLGNAVSGTLTISSYQAPTDRVFGEIVGSFTAILDFGPDNSGRTATIEHRFRIPIDPLLGNPLSFDD